MEAVGSAVQAVNRFGAVDMSVLGNLDFLAKARRRATGSRALYSFPSQGWLAKKAGVCRETVNRHIAKLRRQGVLRVVHRRKVGGFFRSCLYFVVEHQHWGWQRVREALTGVSSRVTKKSHIVPLKGNLYKSCEPPLQNPPSPEEQNKVRGLLAGLIREFEKK